MCWFRLTIISQHCGPTALRVVHQCKKNCSRSISTGSPTTTTRLVRRVRIKVAMGYEVGQIFGWGGGGALRHGLARNGSETVCMHFRKSCTRVMPVRSPIACGAPKNYRLKKSPPHSDSQNIPIYPFINIDTRVPLVTSRLETFYLTLKQFMQQHELVNSVLVLTWPFVY